MPTVCARPWLLLLSLLSGVLFWVTWPLVLAPTSALLGDPSLEAVRHLWALEAGLRDGPLVVDSPWINFPQGMHWVLADPVNLLPYAVGRWTSGPVLGWNLVLLFNLALAGLGAALASHVLVSRPGGVGCRAGAVVGSALVAACLAPQNHNLLTGMTEGLTGGWVALSLVALVWASRHGAGWRLMVAGLLVGISTWAGAYTAVFTGVSVAVMAGWLLLRGPQRGQLAMRLLLVGLVALALAAPMGWATVVQRGDDLPGAVSQLSQVLSAPDAPQNLMLGADPLAMVWPVPRLHAVYLGLPLLLLAGLGARRAPGLALAALGLLVLGLGLYAQLDDEALRVGTHILLLPAGWLARAIGPLSHVTRWYRAVGCAGVLLAPLAMAGAGELVRLFPRRVGGPLLAVLVVAMLGDALFLAPVGWPRPTITAQLPAIHAALPEGGALLELPLPRAMGHARDGVCDRALLEQLLHLHALGGNPHTRQPLDQRVVQLADGLRRAVAQGDLQACGDGLEVASGLGFGWLLVRAGATGSEGQREARCLGAATITAADGWAWKLEPPSPPSPSL